MTRFWRASAAAALFAAAACNGSSSDEIEGITPEGDIPLTSGDPVRQVERARIAPPPLLMDTTVTVVRPGEAPVPAAVEPLADTGVREAPVDTSDTGSTGRQ